MPTSGPAPEPVALFLFAHQDDEFGVFQQILDERAHGRRVVCAYLTNGEHAGVPSRVRNKESMQVLGKLGLSEDDIVFAGETLGIADGRLPESLSSAAAWLGRWVADFHGPAAIYVPAWEGGHQDHDALHAIAVHVAAEHGLLGRTWQFALYNSDRCAAPFFRVLSPLNANGPVSRRPIPWRNRVRFLGYCLTYRSQTKSWLGLLPFVFLHYLRDGCQALQQVQPTRMHSRPHEGRLYYEARGFYTWSEMSAKLHRLPDR